MELSRLTDRIDVDDDGEHIVKRYGMWGTMVEVESCERKYTVVYPDGKKEKHRTLEECRQTLEALCRR